MFLDVSKAFDKVWHKGLLYKLESMGSSGNLSNLIDGLLSERYQRVLLNGQSSEWASNLMFLRAQFWTFFVF